MNHVTLLILEQFSESWSDNSSFAQFRKRRKRHRHLWTTVHPNLCCYSSWLPWQELVTLRCATSELSRCSDVHFVPYIPFVPFVPLSPCPIVLLSCWSLVPLPVIPLLYCCPVSPLSCCPVVILSLYLFLLLSWCLLVCSAFSSKSKYLRICNPENFLPPWVAYPFQERC